MQAAWRGAYVRRKLAKIQRQFEELVFEIEGAQPLLQLTWEPRKHLCMPKPNFGTPFGKVKPHKSITEHIAPTEAPQAVLPNSRQSAIVGEDSAPQITQNSDERTDLQFTERTPPGERMVAADIRSDNSHDGHGACIPLTLSQDMSDAVATLVHTEVCNPETSRPPITSVVIEDSNSETSRPQVTSVPVDVINSETNSTPITSVVVDDSNSETNSPPITSVVTEDSNSEINPPITSDPVEVSNHETSSAPMTSVPLPKKCQGAPVRTKGGGVRGRQGDGQDTSFWDSVESRSLITRDSVGVADSVGVVDVDAVAIKQQRAQIAMELLWVHQAIISRKQYLKLKNDVSKQ